MANYSRRDFLKTGALSGLVAGTVFAGCSTGLNGRESKWRGEAKNVIILVSDGMSIGTLSMADQMKRMQHGSTSTWVSLYEQNILKRGLMEMSSATSIVTDSAAAGASWGCGHRVPNGSLNVGANGEQHTPILTHFRNAGKKTGLVTTTRMTHATPSAFIVNMASRGDEDAIADQMLERGANVLLGGGNAHFAADKRDDGRDMYAEFKAKGYQVARSKSEMKSLSGDGPVLGIFEEHHLPYTVDHVNSEELKNRVPTLAEMTDVAIGRLSGSEGFILQVEGGRVDHAAHQNCAAGLIYDQLAFDDAVAVAYEFANANPDTLLIVTTDHGNANPALNGTGSGYRDSDPMFMRLSEFTGTNSLILSNLSSDDSLSKMREVIEFNTKIAIDTDQATMLRNAMRREYREAYTRMNSASAVLGRILANYTAVSFTSGSHTSDLVELGAMGPGSETINGFYKNTDLFTLMMEAAGVPATV